MDKVQFFSNYFHFHRIKKVELQITIYRLQKKKVTHYEPNLNKLNLVYLTSVFPVFFHVNDSIYFPFATLGK